MSSGINSILDGLGKATRRGVRKCPKCGTANGTRGLSCKNRACDVVFKDPDPSSSSSKKKAKAKAAIAAAAAEALIEASTADLCRLIIAPEISGSIYSIRIDDRHRRGFIHEEEGIVRCFVENCSGGGQNEDERCSHLESVRLESPEKEAQPLTVKVSVLNSMCIDDEVKHEIWLRAKNPGPLVQRVSLTNMVVKCDSRPLPYLHISFSCENQRKWFSCSCLDFQSNSVGRKEVEMLPRCFHFYSCMAVFAGDEKLSKEFSFFISLLDQTPLRQMIAILGQNGETVQIQVLGNEGQDLIDDDVDNNKRLELLTTTSTGEQITLAMEGPDGGLISLDPSVFQEDKTDFLLSPVSISSSSCSSPSKRMKLSSHLEEENNIEYSFIEWLASVSERINQTMHYQFDGHPSPLVFHAPQTFFNRLRDRISLGCRKKRLPNSTTAFVRRDALPLGTFTKYSWSITNILHVKQIFDTVLIPLDITRTFIQKKDGTYELCDNKNNDDDSNYEFNKKKMPKIRPQELKTYLKVGQMSSDSKEITPFIIEWIPDILPTMKVGELRIKFEYGHQRNGQPEKRSPSAPRITTTASSSKVITTATSIASSHDDLVQLPTCSVLGLS